MSKQLGEATVHHGLKNIWYHKGVKPMRVLPTTDRKVERTWHLFDACNQPLGKMTTRIAKLLQGKHKPNYMPTKDQGDFVVVLNCAKVHLTDNNPRITHVKDRFKTKLYRRHTGWPGGLKEVTAFDWRMRRPEFLVEHGVKGQVARNKFRRARMTRLLCYPGPVHPWTNIFPEHPELQWKDDNILKANMDNYPTVKLEDDWVYDTLNYKRYTEIDGVLIEEDLPKFVEGYTEEPHKYPTNSYWDRTEIDSFKKFEQTQHEEAVSDLTERFKLMREEQERLDLESQVD